MAQRTALVLGGRGALGRAALAAFARAGWRTISADLLPPPPSTPSPSPPQTMTPTAPPLTSFVALAAGADADAHAAALLAAIPVSSALDAVFCAAGGWAGGAARDEGFLATAAGMHAVCLQPAAVAARVAALRLRGAAAGGDGNSAGAGAAEAGARARGPALLVLTGAAAALSPRACADMLGYGMAKAASHFVAQAMAAEGALPRGAVALALLPRVLDTPANRQFMAQGADTTSWTPPEHLAAQVLAWCGEDGEAAGTGAGAGSAALLPLPASGSLVLVNTVAGATSFSVVNGGAS